MKKVLFVNWDSYPNFEVGGVYTWEKILVNSFGEFEFMVLNVLSNSNTTGEYRLPKNVSKVFEVPLFGSFRHEEFERNSDFSMSKSLKTSDSEVRKRFLPAFKDFIDNLIFGSFSPEGLSKSIYSMHKFLVKHDCKKCMEHPAVWELFYDSMKNDDMFREMKLGDISVGFQSLQKHIQVFALDIPKADLVHCSQAWFPATVSAIMKAKYGTPVIVTEHGVALRELMLYLDSVVTDMTSNIFWNHVATNIVKTVYHNADVLAPVCWKNASWEMNLGTNMSKINVIYNGVDTKRFRPVARERAKTSTISYIGRIDSWKDIVNLLYAISYVKEKMPVRCMLYGTANNIDYALECEKTVKKLKLQDTVKFMGITSEPEKAYNEADVVISSSTAEGFPLWLIEAMSCGKAVVSTNVGGVKEVLEGCGLLVRTAYPRDLANAIISILQDERKRKSFEDSAVRRVGNGFTLEQSLNKYRDLYRKLTERGKAGVAA